MAGKTAKKASSSKSAFKIFKRGDGRWTVETRGGKAVNGAEKQKILAEAGKIPVMKAKKKEEAAADAPAQ
jgi:hypothetical protein